MFIMLKKNDEAKDALVDLISDSITNGDMETARTALEVLQEESTYYHNNQNAAFKTSIPLDKRSEFTKYCQEADEKTKTYDGPLAAFMASAKNVAVTRKEEDIKEIVAQIKEATLEKENTKEI